MSEPQKEIDPNIKAQELADARKKAVFIGLIAALFFFVSGLNEKHWHFDSLIVFPMLAFFMGAFVGYGFLASKYAEPQSDSDSADDARKLQRHLDDHHITSTRLYHEFYPPGGEHKSISTHDSKI